MRGTQTTHTGSLAHFPKPEFVEPYPRADNPSSLSYLSQVPLGKFEDRSQSCLDKANTSEKVFETYNVLTDKKAIRVKAVPALQRAQDFKTEYKKILGSQFLSEVNRNPYMLAQKKNARSQKITISHQDRGQSSDSSPSHSEEGGSPKQLSPLKFGQRMGYFRHLIDKQGIYSKKSLMHFTRDGHRYIQKEVRDNYENSIDPVHRCDRHDRHRQLPGGRQVPLPQIPTFYQNELSRGRNDNYFQRSKSSLCEDDAARSCFNPFSKRQDESQEWVNQSHLSHQLKDFEKSRGTSSVLGMAKREDESPPPKYFDKSYLSSMGKMHTLNSQASEDVSSAKASIRTIKDLSLMKMLSKGLHHDGKSGDKAKILDSMERNVRDFKKIFEKLKLSARAFNKPEHSPFYQNQFNRYLSLQDMVENEVISRHKKRIEQELARVSPVRDFPKVHHYDPKTDLLQQSKGASISYIDESNYLLEHDKTIPETNEELPRKDTLEAIDSRDASPLKSHRPLAVAAQAEIKSEVEKSQQLRQLAQTAIEAFDSKEFDSRTAVVRDNQKALNTLQPSKTEESDKEFKVQEKLGGGINEIAVRSKASKAQEEEPYPSARNNTSNAERSRNREERVSPLIYNQPMHRPRAGNSKRVPIRTRQTYQQKTNSSSTTNQIRFIEQIEDHQERSDLLSKSVKKEITHEPTKETASNSNGLFADTSQIDSRYSSAAYRPTVNHNYHIRGRAGGKGITPGRHGPSRRYYGQGPGNPLSLNKRLHQSAIEEYDSSFLGGSQTSSVDEFGRSFDHKRQKSEMDFKLEKQLRDQAAKDRIIQALTQREKEGKISILNSNGKKINVIPKLSQKMAEASTSGTATQLASSRQNAKTLGPGQKLIRPEGARPYRTGQVQNI